MTAPSAPAVLGRLAGAAEGRPVALVWIGTVLYSTGPVLVGAASTSGPVLVFWRLWIGVLVFGIAVLVHQRASGRRASRVGWGWSVRAGVALGVHQLCFMSAIKATSVVDVTLMQVLTPVLVGIAAIPLFGERPGTTFRLWSCLAMAGAALVVLAGSTGPEGEPAGMVLAVANVLLFVVYFIWSKQARDHIDVVPFLFGAILTAALTISVYVLVAGDPVGGIGVGDLGVAAAIALLPGALGHVFSTWPLDRVPANIPPVIQLTMPFLAGAMAWVLLDQRITAVHLVGGALTIAGSAGATTSRSGRRLAAEARDVPA